MVICNKCNGTRIKSRTNYSHGRKSKSITIMICKNCGSNDIIDNSNKFKRKRR